MAAKGTHSDSNRLRRAKSASSVPRQSTAKARQIADTSSFSRSNALTAATRAFEKQSHSSERDARDNLLHSSDSKALRRKSKSEGSHLARGSTLGSKRRLNKEKINEKLLESNHGSSPSSHPSIDIRYSKSSPNPSQPTSQKTPTKKGDYYQGCQYLGTSGPPYVIHESGHHLLCTPPSLAITRKRLMVDGSALSCSAEETNADTIAFARDKYLNDHRETALSKSGPFNFGSLVPKLRRGMSKSFSYGEDHYHPATNVLPSCSAAQQPSVMQRNFSFSSSLKRNLRRAFSKRSEDNHNIPAQQVKSRELHYGRKKGLGNVNGDNDAVSINEDAPLRPERYMSPCAISIRSNKATSRSNSNDPTMEHLLLDIQENSRSRVTSWAESSLQNTISTHNIPQLPIIRESTESMKSPMARHRSSRSSVISRENSFGRSSSTFPEGNYPTSNGGRTQTSKFNNTGEKKCFPAESTCSVEESLNRGLLDNDQLTANLDSLSEHFPYQIPSGEVTDSKTNDTQSAALRNGVVSPSIYTDNDMNNSSNSIHTQSNRPTGTASISESKLVRRWPIESPTRNRNWGYVTPSNEWRSWFASKIADLNYTEDLSEQNFAQLRKESPISLRGEVKSLVNSADRVENRSEASKDTKESREADSSDCYREEMRHVQLEKITEPKRNTVDTKSLSSLNFNSRQTSCDSVVISHVEQPSRETDYIKAKEQSNSDLRTNRISDMENCFVSSIDEQERRLSRTTENIVAAERRDLEKMPSSCSIRTAPGIPRTGPRRRAIMPHSSADEGFLLRIRRGPYATSTSPTPLLTGNISMRSQKQVIERTRRENVPPGASRTNQHLAGSCLTDQVNSITKSRPEYHNSSVFL